MSAPPATPPPRITLRWNRHTFALGAALVAMWYAAAAQSNGAVYLLAFACAGMALVSWLHARANLRDIDVQAGAIVLNQRAGCYRLPFRLMTKSKRGARGIEVAAAKAHASVFIGWLEPGVPFRSELMMPAAVFNPAAPATLLIRSLYPLGFFTAELRLPLAQSKKVPLFPQGALSLPAPVKAAASAAHGSPSAAGARGVCGNDDFAGVRAWQPGDSPRHIDWKAAARERPLMTKQWSGSEDALVTLDWNSVTLDDDADKARQFAKWVHECEAQGTRYTLLLPDRTIPAGIGPRHLASCLEALGAMLPGDPARAVRGRRGRIPFSHETSASTLPESLWITCAPLALTLPPMFGEVSFAGMFVLLAGILIRLRVMWMHPPVARLGFVVIGAGLVWFTESEHRSMEAATALLLVFIAGKVIESRSPRDFQVLGLLGWFLCMCGLSLEQSLLWSLYTAGVVLLIAAAQVRQRSGAGRLPASVRTAFTLMVQAAPLTVLMFLFFPRGNEDFVARIARRNAGQSGLSASLDPGSVARVALSERVAFRARITSGQSLAPRERYWRCLVLWECNGLAWRRGSGERRISQPREGTGLVRQTIAIEPHGRYWLPALDRPVDVESNASGATMGDDDTATSTDTVDNARRYTVLSATGPVRTILTGSQRARALSVPAHTGASVRALAASFRKTTDATDKDVVRFALDHLRAQGFKYTLDPGSYEPDALEDFLLRRRLGFCEHFSAAFATLMRLAGVPSRVVVGYLGGEFSERGGYWIVRQCDAHAWTEVWLEETGWTRIDPTAELNPDRLTADLETSLAAADGLVNGSRRTWWWRAWTEARLLWDRLDYEWYNRVVSADEEAQMDALASLGLSRVRWSLLLAALAGCVVLTSLAVFLWLKRAARHPDPAARLWLEFSNRLAHAGLPRLTGEGATAFTARAANAFPDAAAHLLHAGECYNQVRYGAGQCTLDELRLALAKIPKLMKR